MSPDVDFWSNPRGEIIFFANVRDHLQPPEARLLPGEERTQAEDVTRVDVR
jgi:hypothetical protein